MKCCIVIYRFAARVGNDLLENWGVIRKIPQSFEGIKGTGKSYLRILIQVAAIFYAEFESMVSDYVRKNVPNLPLRLFDLTGRVLTPCRTKFDARIIVDRFDLYTRKSKIGIW